MEALVPTLPPRAGQPQGTGQDLPFFEPPFPLWWIKHTDRSCLPRRVTKGNKENQVRESALGQVVSYRRHYGPRHRPGNPRWGWEGRLPPWACSRRSVGNASGPHSLLPSSGPGTVLLSPQNIFAGLGQGQWELKGKQAWGVARYSTSWHSSLPQS
jgi:hypothetical protein